MTDAPLMPSPVPASVNRNALEIASDRTLLPLIFVQVKLGIGEDRALALCEDGSLHPSFNIGRAGGRREIRVCRDVLLAWQPGHRARVSLDAAIAAAFPAYLSLAKSATIRGIDLRIRLSCSQFLIAALLQDGELLQAGKKSKNASPLIYFASVVSFLKKAVI